MSDRHYYRFVGTQDMSNACTHYALAQGYIFRCFTQEEVDRRFKNNREVWERVRVLENG